MSRLKRLFGIAKPQPCKKCRKNWCVCSKGEDADDLTQTILDPFVDTADDNSDGGHHGWDE